MANPSIFQMDMKLKKHLMYKCIYILDLLVFYKYTYMDGGGTASVVAWHFIKR